MNTATPLYGTKEDSYAVTPFHYTACIADNADIGLHHMRVVQKQSPYFWGDWRR